MRVFSNIKKNRLFRYMAVVLMFLIPVSLCIVYPCKAYSPVDMKVYDILNSVYRAKNSAILEQNIKKVESFFDRKTRYGTWAYEYELKKMKYLHNWAEKQGIKFTNINTDIVVRSEKEREDGYRINFISSTQYKYIYENEPDKINAFRIGSYHSMDIVKRDESWIITREWYTDPFADSLNLNNENTGKIREYIISQTEKDLTGINKRRLNAVSYANEYCGAASEVDFNYNKKYRDYNPLGGDCANFASQVLYEGGKFRKNGTWNYDGSGSRAWVNASAFKDYMVGSGRASVIARGTYNQVYKASYKLLPGDFIAYEKKGDITHISVVTAADSKGYALVNCHNTDRLKVPWDLGWSNSGIKFWLVRVHY